MGRLARIEAPAAAVEVFWRKLRRLRETEVDVGSVSFFMVFVLGRLTDRQPVMFWRVLTFSCER